MKGSILAAAALQRRCVALFILVPGPEETCGCSTKVITVWGSPTLVPEVTPESTTTSTSTLHSTSTATQTVTVTPSVQPVASPSPATPAATLPTPGVTSFSSTGVYTIPATTLTVTDTTTVCGATTTEVPSGTHTIGGVTTVVETSTVITCPYATVKPSGTTVTSVIEMTTYTCPAAGTYTVVPGTVTSVPTSTVLVYPTPQTITPGTYTQPATVVTVTRTDYTYVCPFSTGLASTTAPAATVPAVAATTTAVPVPVATSAVSSAPSVVSSAPSVVSSSPAPVSTGSSSSGVTGAGQYGMTFSPYTNGGDCMPQSDIFNNLKIIKSKGFDLVRVYSTDCNGLEYIGSACKELGLKIMMGVFIDGSGISAAQHQVDAIAKWAQWDMVELIVVGNEAISSGACSAGDLAGFVASSKATFKAAGYSGQVTTTEPINIWQQYGKSTLCGVVDIVGANIHPFFNAQVTAEQAGEFALAELKELEEICGKEVINCETGWPNAGDANGLAVPGTAQQEAAIKSIVSAIGSKSVFFSYADDGWKKPGAFNVEQHWGCASVF
ncbi:putative beta-glucosidase btgE [Penicillium oxalicum]|uniref:putative beta-glucosidase btgE n=1 Tax=Penicillium oxalicum TaxID=69781 RepID=UPI0020B6A096|nr:putative beta-glucosidase btgE [Penicillium oxalicum]KAI2786004.1 putative beta-glucosidase btgE [Penicillium oxalicum]